MNNFNEITNEKIYTRLNAKKFYLKYENCGMPLEDILFQLKNICWIDKYIIVKDTIYEGSNNVHVYIKTHNKPNIKSLSYFDLIKNVNVNINNNKNETFYYHGNYKICKNEQRVLYITNIETKNKLK